MPVLLQSTAGSALLVARSILLLSVEASRHRTLRLSSGLQSALHFQEGLTGERVGVLVRVDHAGDALEVGAGLVAVSHCLNSLIDHRLRRIGELVDQEDFLERGLLLVGW